MQNLGRSLLEIMILNDNILPNLNIPRITRTKFQRQIWKLLSLVSPRTWCSLLRYFLKSAYCPQCIKSFYVKFTYVCPPRNEIPCNTLLHHLPLLSLASSSLLSQESQIPSWRFCEPKAVFQKKKTHLLIHQFSDIKEKP